MYVIGWPAFKTAHGWLTSLLGNIHQVRVNGLYRALAKCRLQLIDALVEGCQLKISIEWVPSQKKLADCLTRVLSSWMKPLASPVIPELLPPVACAAMPYGSAPVAFNVIQDQQREDALVWQMLEDMFNFQTVSKKVYNVASQSVVQGGVLFRSVKTPPADDACEVSVSPSLPEQDALHIAHHNTDHGSRETM